MHEIREIPGFEGYAITQSGEVWSRRIRGHDFLSDKWHKLKPVVNKHGYQQVGLHRNRNQIIKKVHRLVLESFVGPCPSGMEACHNDGIKTNNNLANLRWDTRKSNHADKLLHGTDNRGENAANARLVEGQVKNIRLMLKARVPQQEIGRRFGVSREAIKQIAQGRTWRHIRSDK